MRGLVAAHSSNCLAREGAPSSMPQYAVNCIDGGNSSLVAYFVFYYDLLTVTLYVLGKFIGAAIFSILPETYTTPFSACTPY